MVTIRGLKGAWRGWPGRDLTGRRQTADVLAVEVPLGAVKVALLHQGPNLLGLPLQCFRLLPDFILLSRDLLLHLQLVSFPIAEPPRGIAIGLSLLGLARRARFQV